MYEWLAAELQSIATPKFHLVEGAAVEDFREVVLNSDIALPDAYKAFAVEFGNAKFFRKDHTTYKMSVFAGPRRIEDCPGGFLVGFWKGDWIALREGEQGVFNRKLSKLLSPSFDQWLADAYRAIQARYPKKQWKAIVEGPPPFDAEEASMVEARAKFVWRNLGADANGDLLIEIENQSERSIPRFSLGARSLDRRLHGGLHLDVAAIAPGSKAVLTRSCYKDHYPADQMELFDLPQPGPEDREYYFELSRGQRHRSRDV